MPVSRMPRGVQSDTDPYVFLRLLVTVLAPRFPQRPRYEWPTNPSCPLFEWPSTIVVLSSPRTFETSPIEHVEISPPMTVTPFPMQPGPLSRVNDRMWEPWKIRIGPADASKT